MKDNSDPVFGFCSRSRAVQFHPVVPVVDKKCGIGLIAGIYFAKKTKNIANLPLTALGGYNIIRYFYLASTYFHNKNYYYN
jgi:hypothetical protein